MKGFIVAVVILSVIILSLIFYNFYMNKTFSEITEYIDNIESDLSENKFTEATLHAQKLADTLSDKSNFLYLITDREPLNNIITESARLLSFIKTMDEAESKASLSALKVTLTELQKQTVYKTKNPRK